MRYLAKYIFSDIHKYIRILITFSIAMYFLLVIVSEQDVTAYTFMYISIPTLYYMEKLCKKFLQKYQTYERVSVDVIIRNFNISMLNSDVKLDKRYRRIYKDLDKIFKNTYVTKEGRRTIIKSNDKNNYMTVTLYPETDRHLQGVFISYNGQINKYKKMWDRFDYKYTISSEDRSKIAEWYIKNVILY